MAKTKKRIHQMTIGQFEAMFTSDDACKVYLIEQRWPETVSCPRCANESVYELDSKPFHWQCTACAPGGRTG